MSELSEQLREVLAKPLAEDSLRLRQLMRRYIEFIAANAQFAAIMSHARITRGSHMDWLVRGGGWMHDLFRDAILEAQHAERCVEGDPSHIYFALLAVASRVFVVPVEIERFLGTSPFTPQFVAQHMALCERLFLRPRQVDV